MYFNILVKDEAAHRAGNMFRLLQEEQSKLIQDVIEKFEQPTNEFINQEITECFVNIFRKYQIKIIQINQ